MTTKKATRLSNDVLPTRYTLHIHTNFDTHAFVGDETIEVRLIKEQKKIVIHSVGLTIARVLAKQGKEIQEASISIDTKNETAIFSFPKKLKKGKVYLEVTFGGVLSESLAGFYRSTYTEDGVTKLIATTQFEATDARRAFPCFDEPDKKAIFDISLSVPKGKTVISNTLQTKKVSHSKTHDTVHFSPTPIMSTYLLAFIIGDFEYIEKKTKRGVRVRVYTTKGKKHQGSFALECAVRSIDFYEEYFKINYPLEILDMIAVPDFAAGAMENWGAVTYRETALLFDENNSSLSVKQYVAIVVAHELAHQWFGNLVTMSWWTDLWLNEGFASYMEYLCVDALFPEWHMWEQFVAGDLGGALALDALSNTHPVEVTVHHPDEISEVFDAISYEKGASLIRMLAAYLGSDVFRKGLRHYLKKHSYKNTVTTDLWESFEFVSKKPVKKIMGVWTKTAGHPVIHVEKTKKGCSVCQKRFYSSPLHKQKKNKTMWPIPFSYIDGNQTLTQLITKKTEVLQTDSFVIANPGQTGVYRTTYDKEILRKICQSLESGRLSSEDRLGLMRDIHAGVLNCDVSMRDAFTVLEKYRNETEYVVWTEIIGMLTHIRFVYHGSPWLKSFEKFVSEFILPTQTRLGIAKKTNERHTDTLLRSLVTGVMVSVGDKELIKKGIALYKKKHIDPDLRNFVYAAVVKSGDKKLFENLCRQYDQVHMHEEKNRIARARIASASKGEFTRTLAWILGGDVRSQDIPMYLSQALYNRYNKEIALEFVFKQWDYLVEKYSGDKYTRSRIISAMDGFETNSVHKQIELFFKKHEHKGAERTLLQSLEQIEANAYFKKYHEKSLVKIFSK